MLFAKQRAASGHFEEMYTEKINAEAVEVCRCLGGGTIAFM